MISPRETPVASSAKAELFRVSRFALSTLLICVSWLCALLAVGRIVPVLALFFVLLSVPALARTIWLNDQYKRFGRRVSPGIHGFLFLSSVIALFTIVLVGGTIFFVACFAAGWIAVTLMRSFDYNVVHILVVIVIVPAIFGAGGIAYSIAEGLEKRLRPKFTAGAPSKDGRLQSF
jgi:hypothetical protein